jgi:hypothetical protein
MKRSRFSEEQIISILREQEAGSSTADVCRKHGVSSATFYKWKATYGGIGGLRPGCFRAAIRRFRPFIRLEPNGSYAPISGRPRWVWLIPEADVQLARVV